LEHRVREIRYGLITFDGCMLAGKTELMLEIARRQGVQGLDLEDFVERQQGVFIEALRLQVLTAAIERASAKSGVWSCPAVRHLHARSLGADWARV
jgi:hypothetical protein